MLKLSAMGQKRTYAVQKGMSALPRIATAKATSRKSHVCFTPESGHVRCKSPCPLRAKSGHCSHQVCIALTTHACQAARSTRSDVNQSPVGFLKKCNYYPSVLPRDYVGRAKQMETEHGRTTWVVCHSLGWQQQPFFYFSEPPSRLSNNSHHQHLHHPVMARRLCSNRRRLPLPRPQPKVRTTVGTMFSLSLMAAAILSLLRNPTSLAMPRSM